MAPHRVRRGSIRRRNTNEHRADRHTSRSDLPNAPRQLVLDSWKAIAGYFGKTVRTVQRWERTEGLPVHRHLHKQLSSPYAYQNELDAWRSGRDQGRRTSTDIDGSLGGERPPQVSQHAYAHYVSGRYYWEKRSLEGFVRAIREFKKALDIEPSWALPYSGLAEVYLALSANEFWSPIDGYPKARAAANQALHLMPRLPAARTVVGFVRAFFDADWRGAELEFSRALEVDPRCAMAHYLSGMVAMNCGRFQEASVRIRRGAEFAPLSAVITANVGRPLLCAGQYADAKTWFCRARELEPELWVPHVLMGFAHEALGEYDEALAAFENALAVRPGSSTITACIAHLHAKAGCASMARQLLEGLSTDQRYGYVPTVRVARVYVALGEVEDALAWLQRARVDRSIRNNMYLPFDYAFEPLRNDPRFATLIAGELKLPHLTARPPLS